jgi:hypothetical protein
VWHPAQITVLQRYHCTAPKHDVLTWSEKLRYWRTEDKDFRGWAAQRAELIESGLQGAEIWLMRRWRIACEVWGCWLAPWQYAVLRRRRLTTEPNNKAASPSLRVPSLNDAFEDAKTRKSVVKRQNLRGTEICSAVRGEIAIDAKNGDISVGGIGTYCEAYHLAQIAVRQPH